MIRWSYVLPRLVIVGAVLAFVAFGLDPCLRWLVIRAGERVLGAKVELASVRTSLAGAKLQLNGLQAADPTSPLRNLAEADKVLIDLDAEALLLRRIVVDRGHISGLRVHGDRETSGALSSAAQVAATEKGQFADLFDRELLKSLTEGALDNLTGDFESIQLIESASDRWNQKIRNWKTRVYALRDRGKALKAKYRAVDRRDPRQIAQALQEAPKDVEAIRLEVESLRREIEGMQAAANAELAQLNAAHQRDLQRWREKIRVDEVNSIEVTSYFLRPMLNQQMSQVLGWVQQCREIAAKAAPPEARQVSQEEVRFGEWADPPELLIRELMVDGFVEINGVECPFGAVASDIAFPPSRHAKPTRLRVLTRGNVKATVDGVLDYRGPVSRQQFHVDCPRVAVPAATLGSPRSLAFHSAAGHAHIEADATFENGQVKGQIRFLQSAANLQTEVDSSLGNRVRESVQASLGGIDQLSATVRFEGDPRLPQWSIESDLGERVSGAVKNAIRAELDHQQARLQIKLNGELIKKRGQFEAMLAEKKQALLADLNLDSQQLEQILDLAPQLNIGRRFNLPQEISLDGLFKR